MSHLALKVGENNDDSPCLSNLLCFDDGLEQVATFFLLRNLKTFSVFLIFTSFIFFRNLFLFSLLIDDCY
ncbi:hypothetical protein GLYMA_02G138200v4 [Glycine max]|uniref:Uncharacterized protein n=2 Tax=Glycine subgen. Soja TaxID=1462606 RepID=A0A0R0KWN8_SOYBN|nr:hypothetical protein JHK87_003935 [Glycine soja]KAG5063053.1 hypothetical protein JHK85_004236 [Glycine max]KAG5080002.1 hypothetical protein JHK86_004067 [Glycine max]KAH1060234.1 hypothetical protein GYH30_003951 [Glycine max]KRH71271.1 hypothetical protein GLYMA_02G138200v4 [Glycine max]